MKKKDAFSFTLALGMIFLVRSKKHLGPEGYCDGLLDYWRATDLIHNLAGTELSPKWPWNMLRRIFQSARTEVVQYYEDIGRIRWILPAYILHFLVGEKTKNYGEIVYHITQAIPYTPKPKRLFLDGIKWINTQLLKL